MFLTQNLFGYVNFMFFFFVFLLTKFSTTSFQIVAFAFSRYNQNHIKYFPEFINL